MFGHPDYDGHECVIHVRDARSGLRAIIAIHDTTLGPAFGGCRMRVYANDADALADALRLSRGMTFKSAICNLPYGGGKSVIIGDPVRDKTPELLRAMGRAVEDLAGRYIIADDVGTTLADLALMRQATTHTAAATQSAQQPLGVTAHGVFNAMLAAIEHVYGRTSCQGLRVAVQGLGNVGGPLCELLRAQGAQLIVCDTDAGRATRATQDWQAIVVPPEDIYHQEADIFAPCALGGILNSETLPRLKARVVCGGANNQLADSSHARQLHARGILYVPDYLASAGGVIDFHQESIDDSPRAVLLAVERIRGITASVLQDARDTGVTPLQAANDRVRRRLAQVSPAFSTA
ncbi:MAG: Leu/Phe/Val dehydrogenase [Burkholderiales bacterium]